MFKTRKPNTSFTIAFHLNTWNSMPTKISLKSINQKIYPFSCVKKIHDKYNKADLVADGRKLYNNYWALVPPTQTLPKSYNQIQLPKQISLQTTCSADWWKVPPSIHRKVAKHSDSKFDTWQLYLTHNQLNHSFFRKWNYFLETQNLLRPSTRRLPQHQS